jgi:tungstate transport system substrate-binding protein
MNIYPLRTNKYVPAIFLSLFIVSFLPTISWAGNVVLIATTTSTDNTGLLDYLAPIFKSETSIELRWVAVGTGRALKLGENCDVDGLLVHSPEDELLFMEKEFGLVRKRVMCNDFVIVGPENDPASIKGLDPLQAMQWIYSKRSRFASRGDMSGTHKKELSLWKMAGLKAPEAEPWYLETGQGMLPTLRIAQQLGCYTLTDRGTYLKYMNSTDPRLALRILVEGYPELLNTYSIIAINPSHCRKARIKNMEKLINWITSARVQSIIRNFKLFGQSLFIPCAK